jgi:predicted N-acetyltransferase YhbS
VTIVRAEQPADVAGIRRVVEAAFPKPLEAELVDRLRADGDSAISLVAVDNGKVVGHVQFSNMSAPFRALGLLALTAREVSSRPTRGTFYAAHLEWRSLLCSG